MTMQTPVTGNRFQSARPQQYAGRVSLTRRRAWFDGEADAAPDGGDKGDKPESFSREYVEELRQENAKWRKSTRELEKRLEAIEGERKSNADKLLADQQEFRTLAEQRQARIAELEAQLKTTQLTALRASIAAKVGLPAELAERLRGESEDDLLADAETLKALVPATGATETQPAPGGRKGTTTPVPGGPPAGETDAQRRARLFGGQSGVFSGGGVVYYGGPGDLDQPLNG